MQVSLPATCNSLIDGISFQKVSNVTAHVPLCIKKKRRVKCETCYRVDCRLRLCRLCWRFQSLNHRRLFVFFTADILPRQSRKSTGVTNNVGGSSNLCHLEITSYLVFCPILVPKLKNLRSVFSVRDAEVHCIKHAS